MNFLYLSYRFHIPFLLSMIIHHLDVLFEYAIIKLCYMYAGLDILVALIQVVLMEFQHNL